MKLLDRMIMSNPVQKDLAPILSQLIKAVNALIMTTFSGGNPHKVNDVTNTLTVTSAGINDLDSIVEAGEDLRTEYEAHRVSTTHHLAADNTNSVADTSPIADIYGLSGELAVELNDHIKNTSAHTDADGADVIATESDPTTKAGVITQLNAVRDLYEAHRVNVDNDTTDTVHGAADDTNAATVAALDSDATWAEIAALADDLRTQYEAHRALPDTGDGVHPGGADATNTVGDSAIGSVQTAINGLLNELKTDFNAHIIITSHAVKEESMKVAAADATTLATSKTLAQALVESYADHITRADEVSAYPLIPEID
jgi:hypothetical protein